MMRQKVSSFIPYIPSSNMSMTAMKLMLISTNVHSMSRKDNDALTLVEDTLNSNTSLSNFALPFTSAYIEHKSKLDITLQDPSSGKLVEKSHS